MQSKIIKKNPHERTAIVNQQKEKKIEKKEYN